MTEEWMKRMKHCDNIISEKIKSVKEISLDTSEAPQWNRLSMDEYDKGFITAYSEKISDDLI